MDISLWALVGIALASMFFGYFFGLAEGRGQGSRKRAKDEALMPPADTLGVPGLVTRAEHDPGLLVLGMNEGGRPQLQVDGREVDAEHVSAEQRRRLIDLMVMLKPWVDPNNATPAPARARIAAAEPAAPAVVRASAQKPGAGRPAAPAPTPAPPLAQLSLVAQIDDILQGRLVGTPLEDKAIRLAESLHGGALVFVGSTQYEGVDQVPDPTIQAAIRAAIAEWERRYTPG